MYLRRTNQARGYANYMPATTANQKQQEIELRPMKRVQFEESKS